MKIVHENKQFYAAILTDFSKAFACIPNLLIITKVNANAFDQEALKLTHSYLCDRSQKAKVGSSFSKELDILCVVPQCSILGQLRFNIDICDLIFIDLSSDIATYADDTTPYECALYCNKRKIEIDSLQNI